ncbi:unnamed protein product, partial [Symbiodinium sp. KB8]
SAFVSGAAKRLGAQCPLAQALGKGWPAVAKVLAKDQAVGGQGLVKAIALACQQQTPEALELFSQLPEHLQPNRYTYTALFDAVVKGGGPQTVLWALWNHLQRSKVTADLQLMSTMLQGCSDASVVEELLGELDWQGLTPNLEVLSSMLGCLRRAGAATKKTWEVLQVAKSCELSLDCQLLVQVVTALGFANDTGAVVLLMESVREVYKVEPDVFLYTAAISQCARAGDVAGAETVIRLMQQDQVEPNEHTHCAIIAVYSKAGKLLEAVRHFQEANEKVALPIEGYTSLLSGCRAALDNRCALQILKKARLQGPVKSACYTLARQSCALAGDEAGAAKVDKWQKRDGVITHVPTSTVDDPSTGERLAFQPGNDDVAVAACVQRMMGRLKSAGYEPQLWQYDPEISQEEREDRLQFHTEKKALAWALKHFPKDSKMDVAQRSVSMNSPRASAHVAIGGECCHEAENVSRAVTVDVGVRLNCSPPILGIAPGTMLSAFPGWGKDGAEAHERVTPEMWCVTKEDTIGPNMYNVVDNYIKPLCQQAGNSSWALLRNPDGLRCDLFITHGWAEGIYEFIDKVLASWPHGATAAWCCVLANPQNLNIGRMLQSPQSSPFATALKAARSVMVVANRTGSIYARIWCTYEAYLAFMWDKPIFTAHPPRRGWVRAVHAMTMESAIKGLEGIFQASGGLDFETARSVAIGLGSPVFVLPYLTSRLYHWSQKRSECNDLGQGFISILHAEASDPQDKQNILQDIGSSTEDVDDFIRLLLQTTVVTPDTKQAKALGVRFSGVADWSLPLLVAVYWHLVWPTQLFSGEHVDCNLSMICFIACSIAWMTSDFFHKAFIRSVLTKLGIFLLILHAPMLVPGVFEFDIVTNAGTTALEQVVVDIVGVFATACCLLGVSGLARIPRLGCSMASLLTPGAPDFSSWMPACGGMSLTLLERLLGLDEIVLARTPAKLLVPGPGAAYRDVEFGRAGVRTAGAGNQGLQTGDFPATRRWPSLTLPLVPVLGIQGFPKP